MLLNIVCFLSVLRFSASQNIGSVIYLTRWRKIGLCGPSEVVESIKGSSTLYGTKEYWNGVVNVTRDFTADKGIMVVKKCGEGFFPCENFMQVKGGKRIFENLISTPDQPWSTFINAVSPKMTSAHFKKGIYTVTNATLDIEKALLLMPEFPNYYWKLKGSCWEKEKPMFCMEAEFHVVKYTQRDKKIRRNG